MLGPYFYYEFGDTFIRPHAITGDSFKYPELKTFAKAERQIRFYITSPVLLANQSASLVRDHWDVENSLHWVLDMVFRDDECRLCTSVSTDIRQTYKTRSCKLC